MSDVEVLRVLATQLYKVDISVAEAKYGAAMVLIKETRAGFLPPGARAGVRLDISLVGVSGHSTPRTL